MAKRRKQTPAERAYSKQVKRIKQFISRAEKRGYQFSENVLPQRPKRVTQASVRKLAKLTPEKLYQKAVYGGLASGGEIVPAIEGVKLERSLRGKSQHKNQPTHPVLFHQRTYQKMYHFLTLLLLLALRLMLDSLMNMLVIYYFHGWTEY